MAMTVLIRQATTVTPTWATVGAVKWSRVDDAVGTTPIPTPTATGTNFSFVKSFLVDITVTGGLTMTDVIIGKVAAESTTGTLLWHTNENNEAGYTQATAAPGSTGDNNGTAPDINGGALEVAMPLSSAQTVYDAGPYSTTGRISGGGALNEITLGVDATNTTAGTTVATPTLRWEWTEA